ncbi:MAG: hypothetical protein ACI89J_000285 [Hyphomicrobiaceae bacterium]|jgi:uncharacterized protein YbaP (TraB family)
MREPRTINVALGRTAVRGLAMLGCVAGLFVTQAHAKCAGADIIPTLSKTHPEIMAKVRAAADKIINTEAILWRVEKAGTQPSYLFGTMHISDKRITVMPKAAREAAAKARVVVLEIADMSAGAMMKAVMKVPQLMVYTDGGRLDGKLPAEEFARVNGLLAKAGVPKAMAAVMRPWMVSIMLAVPLCEQLRVAAGEVALDAQIGAAAKQKKIPVVGLETVASQLQSMAGVPDADQVSMLRVSLKFIAQREDLFETMIQAYLRRDLGIVLALSKGLAQIAGLKSSGFASFSRELIAKRNHKMFKNSQAVIDKGNAFVAIGAAHLIGKTGLVALYRKAGFTVTAVN